MLLLRKLAASIRVQVRVVLISVIKIANFVACLSFIFSRLTPVVVLWYFGISVQSSSFVNNLWYSNGSEMFGISLSVCRCNCWNTAWCYTEYVICNIRFENTKIDNYYSWFLRTYPPMKMEQTECSETLAYNLQTPLIHPEGSIQQIIITWQFVDRISRYVCCTTCARRPLFRIQRVPWIF
jgi:hypothetical protein